jgi:hypothetical protein
MATLGSFARMAVAERGLITVATLRADDKIQASLVNAGVLMRSSRTGTKCATSSCGPIHEPGWSIGQRFAPS